MTSHKNLAVFDTLVDPEAAKVKNEMLWRAFKPVCNVTRISTVRVFKLKSNFSILFQDILTVKRNNFRLVQNSLYFSLFSTIKYLLIFFEIIFFFFKNVFFVEKVDSRRVYW